MVWGVLVKIGEGLLAVHVVDSAPAGRLAPLSCLGSFTSGRPPLGLGVVPGIILPAVRIRFCHRDPSAGFATRHSAHNPPPGV